MVYVPRWRYTVKSAARLTALLLLAFPNLYAADIRLETINKDGISAAQQVMSPGLPDLPEPAFTKLPGYDRYDVTGLPRYIFTEEARVSAVITKAIENAHYTLDVALYNLQIPDTAKALIKARDRGVKVRVVLDYEHFYPKANSDIQTIVDAKLDIRIMKGRGGSGSMHNKYAIFDGTALETGSANWSTLAETGSYENMMFVFDRDILNGYQKNFEWMWAQGKLPGDQSAGWPKPGPLPAAPFTTVDLNGTRFPPYIFSPRGGTEQTIVRALDAAQHDIVIAMFAFTSKPAMEALTRASSRGVQVRIMTSLKSAFPFKEQVKQARIEYRLKPGRVENGIMHNKYGVVDGRLLINGSFNWSETAETLNTENTIFTTDPQYVAPYKAEFEKLYTTAIRPN